MKRSDAPPILRNLLSDIAVQPSWRGEAAVDMAWRDNEQWSKEQIAYLTSLGVDPFTINLIAPAMDSVTGYEAKHQVDWMVSGASEEFDEMAEGVNHVLNDEMRLGDANHSCSEAYESQAGVGIGWVHVTKNNDPMEVNKVLIEDVHRDEMFWDMRARSETLKKDCRFVARRRFFDKDNAKIFMGKAHHELIEHIYSDYRTIDISDEGTVAMDWFNTATEYTDPIELVMDNHSNRQMVAIYEVYYKVFEKRDLICSDDGNVMEFMEHNPIHREILTTGMGHIKANIPINVCKVGWFIGPHIVYDGPTAEPHNHFPYVAFFGPRKDANNAPYGLISRMRGPQEEYNRAAVEIQRILRSRRIEKDHNALHNMNDTQAIHEINRTDGVVNLRPGSRFEVKREWEKIQALEKICERSRGEINAASGIYQTFQGQSEQDQSGIAVEELAELGAQSLGKINSNYQLARKMVGELAFYHIIDDIGTEHKCINLKQDIGQQKKQVLLNDGANNRLSTLRAQVAMQDIHTSAGYKQHTHMRLTSIMKEVPEDFKGILLPFWLESSEMPKKEQAIKLVNKQLGYEEDENKRAEQEQIEYEEAQQMKQIELQGLQADVADKQASAKEKNAQANVHTADALKKRAETAQLIKAFKMNGMQNITPTTPAKVPQQSKPDQQGQLPPGPSGAPKTPVSNATA